jgi:hypothetical protein
MSKKGLVGIELVTKRGITPLRIGAMAQLRRVVEKKFRLKLQLYAQGLLKDLEGQYAQKLAIHTREGRNGGGETRSTGDTWRALKHALQQQIVQQGMAVTMSAFDIETMARATRTKGFRGADGWFFLYEDGHVGYDHGNSAMGFVWTAQAVELAEACMRDMGETPGSQEWVEYRAHIERAFGGHEGEGIMVTLHEPMFFKYPAWGTAWDAGIRPYKGFEAWNILAQYRGGPGGAKSATRKGGSHTLLKLLEQAMAEAEQELKRYRA